MSQAMNLTNIVGAILHSVAKSGSIHNVVLVLYISTMRVMWVWQRESRCDTGQPSLALLIQFRFPQPCLVTASPI